MSTFKLYLVHLAVILSCCEAYRILVVFPIPGRSHANLGDGIVRHLANDGHEVTYISPFSYKPVHPNVRTIDVSDKLKPMSDDGINIDFIMKNQMDFSSHAVALYLFSDMMRTSFEHENVQKLINDPKEQFDAVIVEWMYSELPAGLAAVFDCPLIWFSSMDVHWMVLRLIDQSPNPAYSGDPVTTVMPPFTFWERANQLFIQIKASFFKYAIFDIMESRAYDSVLAPAITKRGRQPPSFDDVKFNASLLLTNSHTSLSTALTIPQNSIAIGGYHIEEDVKPLPEDLKKIMDNAKNGVIYFSMGSNLKSKHLTKELRDSILKMFGELKQTVLWKFEDDLPNTPPNVHILKWAPQQSILSHPNVVVFITHGGLLSTTETIHFGKPIIGIPVFADQFLNVERAVKRGFAQKVDLSYTMAGNIKLAIEEVISNPKYAEKAKELSLIYHDRPVSPGKELVHWVKHVVKTGAASHLRSPALNVPFYQKLYLDLLAVILVIVFISVKVLKRVYKMFCTKNNVNNKKKKN